MENRHFDIDFFELSFLAEACIPPTPIARSSFWGRMIDGYYNHLSEEQRRNLHKWMNENERYKKGLEDKNIDVLFFEARYNPDNQYFVHTTWLEYPIECFMHDNKYYTVRGNFLNEEFITKIEKK